MSLPEAQEAVVKAAHVGPLPTPTTEEIVKAAETAQHTAQATVHEDLAGRPGIFHLWGDGLMLGEHTNSKVAIETASKLYSAGRFRVVNVYTADGDLVVQYEA